jgi:hypothetical protein
MTFRAHLILGSASQCERSHVSENGSAQSFQTAEAMMDESGSGRSGHPPAQGNPDVDKDDVSSKNNDRRILPLHRQDNDGAVVTQFRGWYALFVDSLIIGSSPSYSPIAEASSVSAATGRGQSDESPICFEVEANDLATGQIRRRTLLSLVLPLNYEGRTLVDPSVGKAICIEEENCRASFKMSTSDVSQRLPDEAVKKIDWYLYKLDDKTITTVPSTDGSGTLVPYRKKQHLYVGNVSRALRAG